MKKGLSPIDAAYRKHFESKENPFTLLDETQLAVLRSLVSVPTIHKELGEVWSKRTIEAVLQGRRKNAKIIKVAVEYGELELKRAVDGLSSINTTLGIPVKVSSNIATPQVNNFDHITDHWDRMAAITRFFKNELKKVPEDIKEQFWAAIDKKTDEGKAHSDLTTLERDKYFNRANAIIKEVKKMPSIYSTKIKQSI